LREECSLRVFENRVLRRIFGPKRDEVTREWRRLHNEELNDLNTSLNIWVIKSRKMRWVGHVACMEERRGAYKVSVGKPEVKRPLGIPRRRWGTILKWILKIWDEGLWTGLIWLRIGTGGGRF